MYLRGHGVPSSLVHAQKWMRRAAKTGNTEAQVRSGDLLTNFGFGAERTKEEVSEGLYWYEEAANQGHSGAAHRIGTLYSYIEGDDRDYRQALYWYKMAARLGNSDSAFIVSFMYFHGQGIPKNLIESLKWLKIAKAMGSILSPAALELLEPVVSEEQIASADELAIDWLAKHPDAIKHK